MWLSLGWKLKKNKERIAIMAYFKTRNIVLSKNTFKDFAKTEDLERSMTLQGVVNKTFLLLFFVVASASVSWQYLLTMTDFDNLGKTLIFCSLLSFSVGFVMVINNKSSRYLAPVYSVIEGFLLGIVSAIAEIAFPGIVMQAIVITVGIFLSLLIIYKLRIIRPTENFKLIVSSITSGIAFFYLIVSFCRKMGVVIPYIHENSIGGIIFSIFVIIMASLNLVMDFDFIEQGESKKIPKYMEWYCAFGLMVTIIWLYLEVLNLLMKSKSRK